MTDPRRTALVVAPHPDDGEIAMGGTIVTLLRQGWSVTLCDLTNGEPTPFGSPAIRAREAARAAEILGLASRITLDLPNRYVMDTVENRVRVAEVIRAVRPELLFVPYWEDAHPDHVQAQQLAEAARFYGKLTKTEMSGEPFYPRRVIHFFSTHYRLHRRPSFLIDVTDAIERKMEAILAYESQFSAQRGNLTILETIRNVGAYFGRLIGVPYAEPFTMREEVGLRHLDALL